MIQFLITCFNIDFFLSNVDFKDELKLTMRIRAVNISKAGITNESFLLMI